MRKYLLNHKFVFAMAVWATFISVSPSNAFAYPSQSLSIVGPASVRDFQIARIMTVLSRPEAQLHLRMAGISQTQVKDALAKLDDRELAQVADKTESVKAGGEVLGLIIVLLVVAILVVLLIKMSNKTVEIKDEKK